MAEEITTEVPVETEPTTSSQSQTKPQILKYVLSGILGLLFLSVTTYAGYWYGVKSAQLPPEADRPLVDKTQIQPTPQPKADRPLDETPKPTPTVEDQTKGWKTYVDGRYKYSIKYPEDWNLNPTPSGMGAVAQISKDGTKVEIGVSTQELQQGQSLEEWLRDQPSLYREEDVTVLSQTSIVVGGVTGIKRVSRLLDENESLMIYIPRGNKVYFISGGREFLTTFEDTFDFMLATFQFPD